MGLSAPQTIYGVHSLSLYNRATLEPFGIIKVVGSLKIALNGSFNDLFGGSSKFAVESESGTLDASLTGTIKEIPNFAFEKFLGASVTANVAEASGNVGTLVNQYGTSVKTATTGTGIGSVAVKAASLADVKSGLYVLKAVSATAVDVYCMSDYDFDEGTDKAFESDLLKITATPLAVATTTDIPGYGLSILGASGTTALTTGDTASFLVRKANAGSDIIVVGQSTATFPEFGCIIASQKKGDGSTFESQIHRAKAIGLPVGLSEKAWLNADINIKALYDSAANAVITMRRIKGLG
jgi:hypothetical protein